MCLIIIDKKDISLESTACIGKNGRHGVIEAEPYCVTKTTFNWKIIYIRL